jgi:hypothetical protein
MVARHRGSRTPAELRQAEYERGQREEQERIAQERADRKALEVERLQQLADAQPDASLFHGEPSFDSSFDPTMGYGGSGVYARPATGWNYEMDTPEITYYEMFGEPSLADIDKFEKEFEELLASDTWSPNERTQLEEQRQSFLAGEINPWSMEVQGMYAMFNIDQREEWQNELEEAGVDSYVPRATNLTEAKQHADEVYMEVLQNDYDENPTDELAQAIEQGPLDFDKAEDVELYNSLSEDSIQRQAFDAQGVVVEDYLNRTQGDAFDSESLEQGQTFSWGWGNKAGTTLLNTGTIVGAPDVTNDNVTFGEFGTHGSYSYDDAPEPNDLTKAVNTTLDVLSIVYPALAPVIQGVKTTVNTGDIEEGFKTGVKTFAVKEIGSELNTGVKETFADLDIDLSNLPEPVQQVLVETTGGVLSGQSGEEALTAAFKNQLTDVVVDDLNLDEDQLVADIKDTLGLDPDFELPAPVQNIVNNTTDAWVAGDSASDAFDSSIKSGVKDYVGDVAEDVVKVGAGAIADVLPDIDIDFETPQIIKDVGNVAVDVLRPPLEFVGETFEPVIEAGEQVLSTAEDVLEPVKEVVETLGEPVVDAVDKVIDAVDSPLGDLLEGALGGTGGMMSGARKPSQVEGLFDKELFKFDTEIKSTQRMLSPTNTRRYG